jgi:uncharacterized protein YjeT (DUF2065 family)
MKKTKKTLNGILLKISGIISLIIGAFLAYIGITCLCGLATLALLGGIVTSLAAIGIGNEHLIIIGIILIAVGVYLFYKSIKR